MRAFLWFHIAFSGEPVILIATYNRKFVFVRVKNFNAPFIKSMNFGSSWLYSIVHIYLTQGKNELLSWCQNDNLLLGQYRAVFAMVWIGIFYFFLMPCYFPNRTVQQSLSKLGFTNQPMVLYSNRTGIEIHNYLPCTRKLIMLPKGWCKKRREKHSWAIWQV